MHQNKQNYTNFSKVSDLNDLELLQAYFTNHSFPRHMHDYYVIEVVERGCDEFYCSGKQYLAPEGSIVIINPNDVHSGAPAGGKPLSYRSFNATLQFLLGFQEKYGNAVIPVPVFHQHVIDDPPLAQKFLLAHRSLNIGGDHLGGVSLFADALGDLLANYASGQNKLPDSGSEHRAVSLAKAFLNDNFQDDIHLEDLANAANMSACHLIRVFRKATGLSPHEYLLNLRIKRARRLLQEGETIAAIAFECGFCDQSHLHRHFRRLTGITPGKYRSRFYPAT